MKSYGLVIDEKMTKNLKKAYECRCGSADCRGTMLALKRKAAPANKAANKHPIEALRYQ